jgi:hypothetical protein
MLVKGYRYGEDRERETVVPAAKIDAIRDKLRSSCSPKNKKSARNWLLHNDTFLNA